MQRFVALSSSTHLSLVLSPVTAWKNRTRDGTLSVRSGGLGTRNLQANINFAFPLIRGDEFSVKCCCLGPAGRGRQPRSSEFWSSSSSACSSSSSRKRRQCMVRARGNRQVSPDPADGSHTERQQQYHLHRGLHRTHRQVADSIRDYASESWWTDGADDDCTEADEVAEGEDGSLSADLWTSRIILQLSIFWNLLGYSPSKIDEWLVSLEARRRLRRSNHSSDESNRFSTTISSGLNNPLEDLSEGDYSSLTKFFSVKLPRFLSAAQPQFRPRERLATAVESLEGLLYPQWLSGMTKTYGTSFMLLVALGYVTQGFRCFPWFAVGYMLKDGLQVDPGYMQFLLSSAALPMVAKPIYGIVSDTVYIRGAHRVPYLAIAGVLQLISWGAIAMSPKATSSAVLLTAALTFGNLGAAIADVMNDALVAEVSKKQKGSSKGELQSFAWLIMASGGLLGNLLGGFALKNMEMKSMYIIFLVLLGLHLVICLFVNERSFDLAPPLRTLASDGAIVQGDVPNRRKQSHQGGNAADGTSQSASMPRAGLYFQLKDQVRLLGQLLKQKEISMTLLWFCASYAVVPVLGSSIFFYQTQVLRIDPTFIGFSRMVGQLGLMVGSQLYGGVLKGLPLRKLLGSVQLLLSVCMLSDLVLVKRLNLQLGIPDEFYVLGASALVDCVSQFKVLPVIVRLGHVCPPGSEGSLMAFFSSCHCLAGLCSGYFGVYLAQHLQISSQSFEGLPVGIFIQAMFALLPILAIQLLPGEDETPSKEEKIPEKVE